MCDAIFFDARELKLHYLSTQKSELAASLASTAAQNGTLFDQKQQTQQQQPPPPAMSLGNHQKFYYKLLKQKQCQFDMSTNAKNNEMMNSISYKRLQYSTRCYSLALMNLISSNFKLYPNATTSQTNSAVISEEDDQTLICPECGLSFDARHGQAEFRHHLIYDCFFTLKYDAQEMKCAIKGCTYSSDVVNDMIAHWAAKHLVTRYECNLCAKQGVRHIFNDVDGCDSNGISDNISGG